MIEFKWPEKQLCRLNLIKGPGLQFKKQFYRAGSSARIYGNS